MPNANIDRQSIIRTERSLLGLGNKSPSRLARCMFLG
jgi:hypothetical protein